MDRTDVDLPDVSYSDGDRELLASPSPSMRRGVSTSPGPRPSRQSQQNVLVVQTTDTAVPPLLPASAGGAVLPQLSANVGHVSHTQMGLGSRAEGRRDLFTVRGDLRDKMTLSIELRRCNCSLTSDVDHGLTGDVT